MLPHYLSLGVTKSEFMHSTPKVLKAYDKAHRIKRQSDDENAWYVIGNYGISALIFAIDHCLNGKKAKSKYVKEPLLKELEEQSKPLTEDQLQLQRELFVAKLDVMKTNFELNHKKDGE